MLSTVKSSQDKEDGGGLGMIYIYMHLCGRFCIIKRAMTTMKIQHYWVQFTSKSICTNSVRGMIESVTTKIDCIMSGSIRRHFSEKQNSQCRLKNKTKMFMSNNQNSSKDTTVQSGQ